MSGLRALGLPSCTLERSPPPTDHGLPPSESSLAVVSPPCSQPPPPAVLHTWTNSCPLSDLRTILFRSSPHRSPPVPVLSSPPASSLTDSSHPITEYYRTARLVVSRVLASIVTDPDTSPSSISTLVGSAGDYPTTRRLDYATRVLVVLLSAGGESALSCDVLDDRKFELEFLAAASPYLCDMLLAPEGDPNALDIPTPCTHREAVSRQ
ncbi:unnamed protein product [Closterium sp. NIES-53]